MTTNTYTIYIKLLDEGVFVRRPTQGKRIRDMIFEVLPTSDYDPEDEHWEFIPGQFVKCAQEYSYSLGNEILVAVEAVDDRQ